MEDFAAGGKGIVLQLRRSRFVTASAAFGDTDASPYQESIFPDCSPIDPATATRMPISTMTKRIQVNGIQQHLSAGPPTIPSGVMQAVLMHALQLRRSCREVFLLCDIQQHSVAEAAQILGISRVAANKRLRLARQQMDEVIERLCAPHSLPAAEINVNDTDASCDL